MSTIRVAAVQFASGTDVDANLATCLRMIDQAAEHRPNLIVLPEFCNRLSWYKTQNDVFDTAVAIGGDFLQAIGDKACEHTVFVVINCTIQRADGQATVTSILFDDNGNRIAEADKQTLMGHENSRFARATRHAPVLETSLGTLGMYACRDGVTMETPRSLAIRGAQLLCNSLNSFAFDEAELHVPVRAPENRVFVVAANKVGPLIPEQLLEPTAAALGVPADLLYGAGESQIVAPDGTVLAKAPRSGEAVVVADIDLSLASNKLRPDGTDMIASRRGALYRPISEPPIDAHDHFSAEKITAAVYQPISNGVTAIGEACGEIMQINTLDLLVLPELFCFENGVITDPKACHELSAIALQRLQDAIGEQQTLVCTTLVEKDGGDYFHTAYLIGRTGIVHKQRQLHRCERHAWAALGDTIETVDLPWGRLGLIVGDDSIYPEVAKVLAIQGADVLAIPFDVQEAWETQLGLVDRSAENRVCLVAATRPKPVGSSLIITQHEEFQIFTNWQKRPFNGTINEPIVTRVSAEMGMTLAEIHPTTAKHKVMSANTDLIQGRAWQLADILTK